MFDICYNGLKNFSQVHKTMLLCMTWGGLGFLNEIEEEVIYLIRDPLFAFNSYSGGGWRKEGGARRIKYVGAEGPNDKKWIDLWLNDFSHWLTGAENALRAQKTGKGKIVRYHNFANDWRSIDGVPPIHIGYEPNDNIDKIKGFLTDKTIEYLREKTAYVWDEIKELS